MRFGKVLGKVVLSHAAPSLEGARWIFVKPLSKEQFKNINSNKYSDEPSCVVYDRLGAMEGDIIGFTEGGEAMLPFDTPIPIDAYNAVIVESINYCQE